LLGEEVVADRAYQVGFINKVVPKGQVLEVALQYAERLSKNAPMVLEMLKNFAGLTLPKGPMELSSIAMRQVDAVMESEDRVEGMKSYLEKRQAVYKGK
jgi:enoyl-CoA hydratase/carnithine racemase